jgi:DNA-directed RNA polymerase subunit RPC12/RpoP
MLSAGRWDEWCPEYYCSKCKTQIATNKTDAEKLDRCPNCKAKFEESKVQE